MKIKRVEMDLENFSLLLHFDTAEAVEQAYRKLVDGNAEERKLEHDRSLIRFLRQGYKIDAIKRHREVTGVGLKEAKDYVDELARANGL